MTLDELEHATTEDLRQHVVECFNRYHESAPAGIENLWEAQFYMQEIDRRHYSWISLRDLVLEIVGVALIGSAIFLAWQQGKNQGALMKSQAGVLQKLSDSAAVSVTNQAATSRTLTALESTTEAMNTAVHNQLARMPQLSLYASFDPRSKQIDVTNISNADVEVWGEKIGNRPPVLYRKPVQIKRGENGFVPAANFLAEGGPKKEAENRQLVSVPVVLFLEDDIAHEYVSEILFNCVWNGPEMESATMQSTTVKQRTWTTRLSRN